MQDLWSKPTWPRLPSAARNTAGNKTVLFKATFIYVNDDFTKTGSGQT
jgi:hypothetical protein